MCSDDFTSDGRPVEHIMSKVQEYVISSGVISLTAEIDAFVVADIEDQLMYLHATLEEGKEITLRINSPGGEAYAALGLYDAIRGIIGEGRVVRGVVMGQGASAASMIVLQACSVRAATAHSRLHLHEPSGWAGFATTSQLKDAHTELNTLNKVVCQLLAERMDKTSEEIERYIERKENWFSATEAKELKLIDEIV